MINNTYQTLETTQRGCRDCCGQKQKEGPIRKECTVHLSSRDCVRRRGWCEGADRATKARSVRAVVLQAAGGAFDGADSGGWLGFEFGVSAFSLQAVFVSADGNMYSSRRN